MCNTKIHIFIQNFMQKDIFALISKSYYVKKNETNQ